MDGSNTLMTVQSMRTVIRIGALALGFSFASYVPAQGVTGRENWSVLAEAYLWGPDIDLENADGTQQEVEFSDLADITRGGFMGGLYTRVGKWRFGLDGIYLEADERIGAEVVEGVEIDELELQVWYVSPMAAYKLAKSSGSEFHVYAGARYLWAQPTGKLRSSEESPSSKFDQSESDSVWDGFIGLHGTTRLNERWYLGYQIDVGAGDSDAVYQALGGLNYGFRGFDATFGYRYLRWDLDSSLFNEIEFNGFYAGAKFFF